MLPGHEDLEREELEVCDHCGFIIEENMHEIVDDTGRLVVVCNDCRNHHEKYYGKEHCHDGV